MLLPSIFNDNVFDDFMDGFDSFMDRSALYGKHGKNLMKTDVRDVGDHYELDMDLPGFKKDEIHAELEGRKGQGRPLYPPRTELRPFEPYFLRR